MIKTVASIVLTFAVIGSSTSFAAEKTVALAVQNMYCAACPHTVKASLQAIRGVGAVSVSLKQRTAIVTYDDAITDVKALTAATTNAGYPSAQKS